MKKLQKISSYILATMMVLLGAQFSVFAAGDAANNESSLTAFQVIGGLAILLFVILVPLMRGAGRHMNIDKK